MAPHCPPWAGRAARVAAAMLLVRSSAPAVAPACDADGASPSTTDPRPPRSDGQHGRQRRWWNESSTDPLLRRRRSEEHTSELQSLMRIPNVAFCLKQKITLPPQPTHLTKTWLH